MARKIKIRRSGGRIVEVSPEELERIEANRTAGEPLEYVSQSRIAFAFRFVVLLMVIAGLLAQSFRGIL